MSRKFFFDSFFHCLLQVIDAPPRNVTLDLNDLQNTYNRKLLNGSATYNHFSASDGDSDRELLKGKNFDVPYGSPFDAIQRRRLPELPKPSESSGRESLIVKKAILRYFMKSMKLVIPLHFIS